MAFDPNTAWQQISRNTKMACGARNPVGGKDTLHFNVLRGTKTKIVVTYEPMDTYHVQLGKIGNRHDPMGWVVKDEMAGVYAEDLSGVIYRMCNK